MSCNKDRLDSKLKEIQYDAEHSVTRGDMCRKNVLSDLKQKTQNVIFEAHDENRPDIKKRAEKLLYELNYVRCY